MEEQPEPDLTYVTERILAVLLPQHSHNYATTRTETNTTSPSITNNSISHRQMAELASMLRSKHGNNYLVLNLSGSQQESEKLHPQVQEYAWPAQHAPPLDVLCSVCKAMDSWLHSDPKHITVIQTKGSKGQLGVVIAAYMYYNSICACADQALDRYAMHRFYDDQVAAESQPSQRRYVGYFSQLLSGRVKVNSQPLYLHGLLLHQLPSLSPAGGCRPFIKIYQALQLIYTSEVFEVPPEMDLLCINIVPGLPLKGDIMVVCYHMLEQGRKRESVFRMQFHTCVVQNFSPLVLRKAELDNACTDARFPDEGSLELIFSPDPDKPPDAKLFGNNSGIRVNNRKSDPIVRWDSYLDFSTTEMQSTSGLGHTEGPVDGSLYARVRKKGSTDSGTATSNSFSPPGCQAEDLESTTPNPVVHSVSNEQGNLEQAHNCSMSFDSGHSTTSAQTDSLMPSRAMHLVPAQVHANGTCPPRETAILNDEEEEEDRKLGIGMKDESESERGVPIPAVPIWSEPFQSSGCSDVRTGPFQEKSSDTGSTFGLESAISSKVEMQAGKMSPQLAASVSTDPHLVSRISSNSTLRNDRTHSPLGVNNARAVNGIVNLSIPENVVASSPKYPSDWQRLDRSPQEWNQDTPQQAEFGPVCGPIESQIAGVRTAAVPSIPARTASSRQAVQRTLSGLNGRSRPLARRQQSDTTFDRERRPGLCNYDLEEAMLPRLRAEEDFERSLQELNRLILELNHKVVPFGSPGSRPNCSIIHEQHQQLHSPVENNSVVPIDLAQPFVQHLSPQSMTNCVSPKTFSPHTPCFDLNMDMSPSDRRYYYLNGGRATQNENGLPNQVKTCLNPVEESIIYSSPTSLVHVRENRTPLSSRPIGLLGSDMFPTNSASVVPVSHSKSHMQEGGAAPVCNNSTIQSSDTGKQGLRRTDHEDIARLHDVERSPMESSSPAQDVTNSENVSPTNSLLYGTSSTPAFPVCPPTPYINQGRFTPSPLRGATLSALHLHSPPRTAYSRDIAPVPEAWTPNGTYPCHSEGLSDPSACGQSSPSQGSPTERVSGLDHIQLSASPSLPSHTYRLPMHQWIGQDSSHIPTAFHAEPHEQSSYGFLNGTPRWASSTTVEALGRASHTASTSSADIYRHPSLTSLPNESTMESRARVKFVQDTTKYWYKKDISRDQAVTLLKDKEPGAFVIRDSHSYRGAYGLAVKVSEPPPGLEQPRKDGMLGELGSELVRHYLIESTSKGVRLKGCINEPTFGSLSALVYQHSITPLALPCRLVIPCQDPTEGVDVDSAENHTSEILKQGAACNVLYLGTVELESLTGPEALGRAIRLTLENPPSEPTVVHFKAAAQGITLTDHQRKVFFRRYYKASSITFCDVDPQLRKWPIDEGNCASIFGFVARKQGSHGDNQCHVFAELERDQPAAAITGFVCKALLNAEPIS